MNKQWFKELDDREKEEVTLARIYTMRDNQHTSDPYKIIVKLADILDKTTEQVEMIYNTIQDEL